MPFFNTNQAKLHTEHRTGCEITPRNRQCRRPNNSTFSDSIRCASANYWIQQEVLAAVEHGDRTQQVDTSIDARQTEKNSCIPHCQGVKAQGSATFHEETRIPRPPNKQDHSELEKAKESSTRVDDLQQTDCKIQQLHNRLSKLRADFVQEMDCLDKRLEILNHTLSEDIECYVADGESKENFRVDWKTSITLTPAADIGARLLIGLYLAKDCKSSSTAEKQAALVARQDSAFEEKFRSLELAKKPATNYIKSTSVRCMQFTVMIGMVHVKHNFTKCLSRTEKNEKDRFITASANQVQSSSFLERMSGRMRSSTQLETKPHSVLHQPNLKDIYHQHTIEKINNITQQASLSTEQRQKVQALQQYKYLIEKTSPNYQKSQTEIPSINNPLLHSLKETLLSPLSGDPRECVEEKILLPNNLVVEEIKDESSPPETPIVAIKPRTFNSFVSYLETATISSDVWPLSIQNTCNEPPDLFSTLSLRNPPSERLAADRGLFSIEEESSNCPGFSPESWMNYANGMTLNPFFGCDLDDKGDDKENNTGVDVPYPLSNILYGAYPSDDSLEHQEKSLCSEIEDLRTKWVSINDSVNKPFHWRIHSL